MYMEFGELYSKNEISNEIYDVLSPVFKRNRYSSDLVARHYVWHLKWIYYKDLVLKPAIIKTSNQ